jgi:hypothetical protein
MNAANSTQHWASVHTIEQCFYPAIRPATKSKKHQGFIPGAFDTPKLHCYMPAIE